MTSKRTSVGLVPVDRNQAAAADRSRTCRRRSTASAGHPKEVDDRVFTSLNTTMSPRPTIRSSSPEEHRQLRASTR